VASTPGKRPPSACRRWPAAAATSSLIGTSTTAAGTGEVVAVTTDFYISPAEQRYELAVTLAFESGRDYERAAAAELARLEKTWDPELDWATNVAKRAAKLGPSKPIRYDDPEWPPVAVPGGAS